MSGKGLEKWEEFQAELNSRSEDIGNLLPSNVKVERFKSAAVAAAKHNPDLLFADKRSLFNALTKAAQDGLLPDGREAHIAVYDTKVKRKIPGTNADEWVNVPMAQYNPMTYGIRKRALELGNLIIDAQVVHKNDVFKRTQGDNPSIIHEPADFDADRGAMIGVYAIFKQDGVILHRETMSAKEVEDVRSQSRNKEGLMWTKFASEGWRKSVIRRGIKTVPVSEDFERIVRRDDENFDFSHDNHTPAVTSAPATPALTPPPPPSEEEEQVQSLNQAGGEKQAETVQAKPAEGDKKPRASRKPRASKAPASEAVIDQQPKTDGGKDEFEIPAFLRRTDDKPPADHVGSEMGLPPVEDQEPSDDDQEYANWRLEMMGKVDACENEDEIQALKAGVMDRLKTLEERKAFNNACAEKAQELFEAKRGKR